MRAFFSSTIFAVTIVFTFGLGLGAGGCVAQRTAAWSLTPPKATGADDGVVAKLIAEGDAHWLKRQDPAELDAAARSYAEALRNRPRDPGVLVRLGRAAYRRGAHERKAASFERALQYAERALTARNPKLAAAARAGRPPIDLFTLADEADVPALVLYAEALLAWSVASGTPTVINQREAIRAAANNALRFDRSVGWGAPDRVLGILECELPEARQNLSLARDHFEAAIAAAPAFLPTRVDFAEEYAPRVRDLPLYRRLLDEVVAADPHALPEAEPENRDAQRNARDLLQRPR